MNVKPLGSAILFCLQVAGEDRAQEKIPGAEERGQGTCNQCTSHVIPGLKRGAGESNQVGAGEKGLNGGG